MEQQDLLTLLLSGGLSPEARNKGLASLLRGQKPPETPDLRQQRDFSTLAMATGDPVLSKLGAAQMDDAQNQATLGAQTEGRQLTGLMQALAQQQTAEERKIDNARADAGQEETKRFHQYQMDHPTQQVVVGPGNNLFAVNTKNIAAGAVPVNTAGTGAQLQKPKELGESETKALEAMAAERDVLRQFGSEFKDEYAGGQGARLKTLVGQTLGGSAPKGLQDAGSFWSKFEMLRTLPTRKDVFGSSLSTNEKASFDRANLLTAQTDPAVIRKTVAELTAILDRKLAARTKSEIAQGASPEAVQALTGGAAPAAPKVVPHKNGKKYQKDAEGNWLEL